MTDDKQRERQAKGFIFATQYLEWRGGSPMLQTRAWPCRLPSKPLTPKQPRIGSGRRSGNLTGVGSGQALVPATATARPRYEAEPCSRIAFHGPWPTATYPTGSWSATTATTHRAFAPTTSFSVRLVTIRVMPLGRDATRASNGQPARTAIYTTPRTPIIGPSDRIGGSAGHAFECAIAVEYAGVSQGARRRRCSW